MNQNDYILQVGDPGCGRLDILHRLLGKSTEALLATQVKDTARTILDIGCGVGNTTRYLSRMFSNAEIYGLDNSVDQLAVAESRALDNGCPNIQWLHQNIGLFPNLQKKFDVIYLRYVLIHIANPLLVVKYLQGLLTPGGKVIIEEPTMSTAFCYPDNVSYTQSRLLLKQLSLIKGLDFEIGKKLQNTLLDLGFDVNHIKLVQPLLRTEQEKQLLMMIIKESAQSYLEYNLATEKELAEILSGLSKLISCRESCIGFPTTTQICATF